jgi:YVTN family beta-propeller protein
LIEGTTAQLTTVVRDTTGTVSNAPVTYVSRDLSIVTVSSTGEVIGQFPGTAYVVASSGGKNDSLPVTVLVHRVARDGRPLGAAINGDGVAIVTLLDAAQIALGTVPRPDFKRTIAVGSVPTDVQFNSTGTRAYVANQYSQSVSVIDVATSAVVQIIPVRGDPFKVFVPPGDSILWVTTNVDSAYAFRLATLAIINRIPTGALANGFVGRGPTFWLSTRAAGTVLEISTVTNSVVRTFAVGGMPQDLALSDDSKHLYIVNEAGYVQVWDTETGLQVGEDIILPGGGGYGMAREKQHGYLYITTGYYSHTVWILDPEERRFVRRIVVGGVPRRVAFNPQGTLAIIPNEGGWIDVIR